ncbi:hypothetical protein SAY87_029294 [Trapa incisa]|uniref:mitogen-activated protein kinase n=1 Tax=Trapa incisa TaxID=236973 RepID=A0AAN7KE56_9MYRT|nr:hypothetical protein SAY87_029294 [Trapa incisa]
MQLDQRKKSSVDVDFFTEYGEGSRYKIEEVIGKGSYGVVCSAYDTHLGEKVAIKKINDIFEHVSDATRILREIKLLRLLRHPDVVEIKHILLPPSRREFKDIYVVFELMESDLHQVIKANDDLTPEHYQFFLYQLLRGLKYIHTGPSIFEQHAEEKADTFLTEVPKCRPTCSAPSGKDALADPYFKGLAKVEREPSSQPVTKIEFEFERRRVTKEEVRELIYREILQYHPKMLKEFLEGSEPTNFMYPSAVDHFKKQFAYLEEHYGKAGAAPPPERQHASLPRACVLYSDPVQNSMEVAEDMSKCSIKETDKSHVQRSSGIPMTRLPLQISQNGQGAAARPGKIVGSVLRYNNCNGAAGVNAEAVEQRRMMRNTAGPVQYSSSTNCSYPRRNSGSACKNDRGEEEALEGVPSEIQGNNAQHIQRKVAAAQGGSGSHWY